MPLDPQLATSLKAAKTKRMFFALVAKGLDGKLMVDKKKIPSKEIAEAKKECGGGTVYRGRCQGDEGGATLVFEVAKEPPGTLAATTKKIIKESTGLSIKAEFRVVADAEAEGDGNESEETPPSEAPPPPPAAPDDAGKRFADRLKMLVPLLQHALATGKPEAEQAKQKIAEANAAFRNKDATQAIALLDQAVPLIKLALADAKPAAAGSPDEQAWQERIAIVEPQYLDMLKGNPPDANKLRALMAFATGKADAGEHAKALAALKQLEPLLRQAKPSGNDAFAKDWAAAKTDLRKALAKVTKQLTDFALAILETNEENLVWVAEEGLTLLLTSLRDDAMAIERATSKTPARVVAKARPAIANLRKQLQSAEVKACDHNQLGVNVNIVGTIGNAINRLEEVLATVE